VAFYAWRLVPRAHLEREPEGGGPKVLHQLDVMLILCPEVIGLQKCLLECTLVMPKTGEKGVCSVSGDKRNME